MVHLALSTRTFAPDDSETARRIGDGNETRARRGCGDRRRACVSRDATLEEAGMIIRSTFVTGFPVIDLDGVLVRVIEHAQLAAHRFARPTDSSERGSAKSASAR